MDPAWRPCGADAAKAPTQGVRERYRFTLFTPRISTKHCKIRPVQWRSSSTLSSDRQSVQAISFTGGSAPSFSCLPASRKSSTARLHKWFGIRPIFGSSRISIYSLIQNLVVIRECSFYSLSLDRIRSVAKVSRTFTTDRLCYCEPTLRGTF